MDSSQRLMRFNPERVPQHSLGSMRSSAPQDCQSQRPRTLKGFHSANVRHQEPCGTPLGFNAFSVLSPGVRRCTATPGYVVKPRSGLFWSESNNWRRSLQLCVTKPDDVPGFRAVRLVQSQTYRSSIGTPYFAQMRRNSSWNDSFVWCCS